jgi:hypothetical protein
LSTWLVKIKPFPTCASSRSLAWPSAKHDRDLLKDRMATREGGSE